MSTNKNCNEPVILAYKSFVKKNYAAALKHLIVLCNLTGNHNKRVVHNEAVVKLMQSDLNNVEEFKTAISNILGLSFPEYEIEDYSIHSPYALYNYAVILYHSRHYYQCAAILEKFVNFKVLKDLELREHIFLLYMESTFCTHTYNKTLEIANNHGDQFIFSKEGSDLYKRLIVRTQLMTGQKIQFNLKPNTIENAFVIAQQQYINGDVNEAANTLALYKTLKYNYDFKTQGEDIWAAINNNLGVIYLSRKKPYLATKYFQNAVKEYFKTMKCESSQRLITCRDRPLYIYNLGLALLATKNTLGAFECLVEATFHYPKNPRLWLHLAECCVKNYCSDEPQQFTIEKLVDGPNTSILLSKDDKNKTYNTEVLFAIPSLTLEYAALSLRNAEALLPNIDPPSDITIPLVQTPPGPPINWKQCCELRNSILLLQSYVYLHLQDPLAAVTSANNLLKQENVPNSDQIWAHIYAAEALIYLDRVTEAVQHLNPLMIQDLILGVTSQMRVMMTETVWAKSAVCHILKGDYVTAHKISWQTNSPRLKMYMEICTGNIQNCAFILRNFKSANSL